MEVLKKGSIESILVPLRDRLNNVTTLASVTGLVFDTKKKSDGSAIQTDSAVTLDPDYPMTGICRIDTTIAAYVSGEEFKLYIKYTSGSESPLLGPLFFRVEDD